MMSSSSDELLRNGVEPAIDVQNLRVIRGKRVALVNISVQIARGTITGLLGPSGCGKTTLMRSVVGTQIIAEGTVTVLGRPAGSAELRHRVGYVTQDPTIYNDLRIIDNVHYFAALYGTDSNAADQAISAVGLDDHQRHCAATYPAVSAPGRRWPVHWWPGPTCWCSTNPPSALTPCCASTSGSSSTNSPGAERLCSFRAT
jgi:ABC-type glutathione transport system ATPase component